MNGYQGDQVMWVRVFHIINSGQKDMLTFQPPEEYVPLLHNRHLCRHWVEQEDRLLSNSQILSPWRTEERIWENKQRVKKFFSVTETDIVVSEGNERRGKGVLKAERTSVSLWAGKWRDSTISTVGIRTLSPFNSFSGEYSHKWGNLYLFYIPHNLKPALKGPALN